MSEKKKIEERKNKKNKKKINIDWEKINKQSKKKEINKSVNQQKSLDEKAFDFFGECTNQQGAPGWTEEEKFLDP